MKNILLLIILTSVSQFAFSDTETKNRQHFFIDAFMGANIYKEKMPDKTDVELDLSTSGRNLGNNIYSYQNNEEWSYPDAEAGFLALGVSLSFMFVPQFGLYADISVLPALSMNVESEFIYGITTQEDLLIDTAKLKNGKLSLKDLDVELKNAKTNVSGFLFSAGPAITVINSKQHLLRLMPKFILQYFRFITELEDNFIVLDPPSLFYPFDVSYKLEYANTEIGAGLSADYKFYASDNLYFTIKCGLNFGILQVKEIKEEISFKNSNDKLNFSLKAETGVFNFGFMPLFGIGYSL
jgi:hypothetical protein